MRLLGIIPARGGSKGIPRKNIRDIAGKPLIAWSIEAAQNAKSMTDFLVSTDDQEIADVAQQHGAPVLLRPPELATDEARTIDVLQHVLVERPDYDAVMVLQPTSPLRAADLLDDCVKDYLSGDYDNLATGFYCKFREFGSHNNERRQDYTGFFYDDGNVYILHRELVKAGRWSGDRIFKKEIPKEHSFEIDDEVDMLILETLLNRYGTQE